MSGIKVGMYGAYRVVGLSLADDDRYEMVSFISGDRSFSHDRGDIFDATFKVVGRSVRDGVKSTKIKLLEH